MTIKRLVILETFLVIIATILVVFGGILFNKSFSLIDGSNAYAIAMTGVVFCFIFAFVCLTIMIILPFIYSDVRGIR